MKNIFLSFILTILSFYSYSQHNLEFSGQLRTNKRVIVIPFDKKIYFNDATDIIAEKDKLTHDEIMEYFRYELNNLLIKALADSCYVINMLTNSNTREEEEIIDTIFSIVSYEMAIAHNNKVEKEGEKTRIFKRKKQEEKHCETTKSTKTKVENGEIVCKRTTMDDKYLKIVFSNKKLLQEIAANKNADYFLFINQFEIKCTDYRDPYISGNKNATRTIRIHFSIYDYAGHYVHGSFAENVFPFRLNDKQEIINIYFSEVIRQIISNIQFK